MEKSLRSPHIVSLLTMAGGPGSPPLSLDWAHLLRYGKSHGLDNNNINNKIPNQNVYYHNWSSNNQSGTERTPLYFLGQVVEFLNHLHIY